jgi:membrane associated rhomboid family serine protease
MEQKTDARSLVARGDALLAEGQAREAAAAYAEAVQAEPGLVGGHMGLAEANLALGGYGVVYLAARQVQALGPDTADAALATAILFVLEQRYEDAVRELDRVAELDPGRAYAHALRGYCLRQLGRSYDAQQAEGKARRLSSGKDYSALFPRPTAGPQAAPAPQSPLPASPSDYTPPRSWENASPLRRTAVRARFATRNVPIVTFTLMGINIFIYLLTALSVGDFGNPSGHIGAFTPQSAGPIYYYGIQYGPLMQQNPLQWYRVFTAMFLHASIEHIALNMLSLYFVGVVTEQLFGHWRFALIYFVSGIVAGVAQFLLSAPDQAALGASGAIFGIFGAFGAFVILRRSVLGRAANPIIGQWLFFLVINLAFSIYAPGIALYDHVGGLIAGLVLGALLMPRAIRIGRSG